MTGFLNARGGRIAYEQTGQGPWLCVPGLGDLRGHGESSINWTFYSQVSVGADLIALIRHLGGHP
jgi:pimeloyl-ACP methyl ester carboxylesterase